MAEDAHELLRLGNLLRYDTAGGAPSVSAPTDEAMVYDGMDFSSWDRGKQRMNG